MSSAPMAHFVILAAKPGIFHTEIGADTPAVECYDYLFHGRVRARFVIAQLLQETKIRVVDEGEPPTVSQVPSKLLKKYGSVSDARRDLELLVKPELHGTELLRIDA